MKMKKPVLSMRSLTNDTSRCYGVGCRSKAQCMRYAQIEQDVKTGDDGTWVSYIATMIDRDSGHCSMRIEID